MFHRKLSAAAALAAFFFALAVPASAAPARTEAKKKLTYEQAFLNKGPLLLKPLTASGEWLDDEHYLVTEIDKVTKTSKMYKVRARTGEKELFLDFEAVKKNAPEGFPAAAGIGRFGGLTVGHTEDWSGLLYSFKNDLYFYRVKEGRMARLTHDDDEEKNPRLSPTGDRVAFTRNNNLFTVTLSEGREAQLTRDGGELISNGRASWVYFEEILGRASRYAAFWWSPDGEKIAFLRFDDNPVPEFPIYDAEGRHGRLERQRYPKAGDPNPKVRLGVVPAAGGPVVWADFDEDADHYVAWPFWLPDSSRLSVQWMNRAQDTIRIYLLDPATGKKSALYEETQPSWVEFFEDLYFFKDGSGFLLRSDKSGWRHLYLYDGNGRLRRQLTDGPWSVQGISLVDEKNKRIYFTANRDAETENHLYRIRLDGRGLERLTPDAGTHFVQVSPGGGYFLDTHSQIARPTKLDLRSGNGALVRLLEDSRAPEMDDYALGRVELFTIPTSDGWNLPASWILPPDFDPGKTYPVLLTVYGGPATPRVYNSFPPLSSFYLAQEGIIVLTADHRGSGHFGKQGTALMHRSLGKWEIHDWVEAVKWLRGKPFVDPARVGITGGSYGGYATCLALTAAADFFTHGFARASVTDWHLYDTVYTERYMDTPAENPEGYKNGSVMTHAPNFKGVLHIEHGALDDNVHAQNSIQLIDRLIDLDKDFTFMLLPKQRHGSVDKKREFSNRQFVAFWLRHFLGR
ncbi:MAG: S9 family peptidase [Candidatus Aminicenantes bacterium]|nr:S9 family peptidase [Candidatus Aminicenantes bacterium]